MQGNLRRNLQPPALSKDTCAIRVTAPKATPQNPMNTFHSSALALVVLLPAAVLAASFEGKVNFKVSSPRGQPQEISYSIKGDKIRVEMPGQDAMGGMIMDTTKRETTVIMDAQKMYMTMAKPEGGAPEARKGEESKLEKTGEKETILGYATEKYISTHKGTSTEMWLVEGLGTFMMAESGNPMGGGGRGSSAPPGWERALAGKELFPLRVVDKDKNGKETSRMEVTAIEKKALPDALFSPPADYQKFDMGGMMKGLMPGRP